MIKAGANVNQADNYGRAALYMAALRDKKDLARLYLKHGAKLDARASWKGDETAIHVAAEHGHNAVLMVLFEYGADPNTMNYAGDTPLHLAAWAKHPETVRLLLSHGANIRLKGRWGRTALNGIGETGKGPPGSYLSVVKCLVAAGLDPNTTEKGGGTPLMDASACGATDVVEYLLQHGARVDAVTKDGFTALIDAAFKGHEDVVKQLLAHGADKRKVDNEGKTARDTAIARGHGDLGL